MTIDLSARFSFCHPEPTDILLQFEAAAIPEQRILRAETLLLPEHGAMRVAAQDSIGERVWVHTQGELEVSYSASVAIARQLPALASLGQLAPRDLPGETVPYLLSSLYCPADRLRPFVREEFAGTEGGARIAAIRDWIADRFTYEPGSSTSSTTALDSFVERRGICRDYAHVLITFARAAGIPARYASVYAPGVEPQDFHAVAEVFLADPGGTGGTWQLVDATQMADPAEMVKIGVGRDAADVSFMTSFGPCRFGTMEVRVDSVPG